jgi:hypothetical protein
VRSARRDSATAAALATAIDTPSTALAPSADFVSVPSSASSVASTPRWSNASSPATVSAIGPFTFATAPSTPLPPKRPSPSRSSSASCSPVEAPLGTPARPNAPSSSQTSTSTVGLPRESRISRPRTVSMEDMGR